MPWTRSFLPPGRSGSPAFIGRLVSSHDPPATNKTPAPTVDASAGSDWPGHHHGQRRQRRWRHYDLLRGRCTLRVRFSLDDALCSRGIDSGARNERPARRSHGRGPGRPDTLQPWGAFDSDHHRPGADCQSGQHGERVRRCRGEHGDFSRQQVRFRAYRRRPGVVFDRQGKLSVGRAHLSGGQWGLSDLRGLLHPC